jgi:hypothetical protein
LEQGCVTFVSDQKEKVQNAITFGNGCKLVTRKKSQLFFRVTCILKVPEVAAFGFEGVSSICGFPYHLTID